MRNTLTLIVSISDSSVDLLDAMTGEVFTSGTIHINEMLNLLNVAGVDYTIRIESSRGSYRYN